MLRFACVLFPLVLLASTTHAASVCDNGAPLVTVTPGSPATSSTGVGLDLCIGADSLFRPTEVSIEGDDILVTVFAYLSPLTTNPPPIFDSIALGLLPSGAYDYTVAIRLLLETGGERLELDPYVAGEGSFTVAPEPRTAALACLGLCLLAIGGRDRRKRPRTH